MGQKCILRATILDAARYNHKRDIFKEVTKEFKLLAFCYWNYSIHNMEILKKFLFS